MVLPVSGFRFPVALPSLAAELGESFLFCAGQTQLLDLAHPRVSVGSSCLQSLRQGLGCQWFVKGTPRGRRWGWGETEAKKEVKVTTETAVREARGLTGQAVLRVWRVKPLWVHMSPTKLLMAVLRRARQLSTMPGTLLSSCGSRYSTAFLSTHYTPE